MKTQIRLPKARLLTASLLLFSFFIIHQSCTKADTLASTGHGLTDAAVTQKFFALPANASLAVKRAAAEMQKRNATSEFVAAFVKKNGYPLWDKATVVAGTGIATKANSSSATQEGDTLVVVPVLQDSSSTVKSFINITLSGEVSLAFYRGGDYSVYSYDDVPEDSINADKAAIQIMWLNYKVFGATKFIVNDDKLFMDGAAVYTGPHPRIIKIDPPTTPVLQGRFLMVQICNQIPTIQGCSCWHHDITQCSCTIPNCCWRQSCWYIYFPPYDDSPGGSGGGSGDPTGEGGGGTGGDFPCASSQGRTIGIADPCGGSSNPPPVVPLTEAQLDAAWMATKFKDSTNNPCVAAALSTLNTISPQLPGMVRNFFGVNPTYQMTVLMDYSDNWQLTNLGWNRPKSASTTAQTNLLSPFQVKMNSYYPHASDLSMVATILHETLHCQFLAWAAQSNGDTAFQNQLYRQYGYIYLDAANIAPSIMLIVNGNDPTQHAEMANRYVDSLAAGIYKYAITKDYNVNLNYCRDLAWAGLQTTLAYENFLLPADKIRISETIDRELSPFVTMYTPDQSPGVNSNQLSAKGRRCD
jgi:hypothetical protein